jgi:acetyl esterase/lipase
MDPLRDEQFIYEHVLREQGVKTKVTVYAGIPHGATELLPMLSHAKKAVSDYTEGVQWILKQGTK